jgi:hypothetical protein
VYHHVKATDLVAGVLICGRVVGTGPAQIPTLTETLPLDESSWSTFVDAAASTAARAKRAILAAYELACAQF